MFAAIKQLFLAYRCRRLGYRLQRDGQRYPHTRAYLHVFHGMPLHGRQPVINYVAPVGTCRVYAWGDRDRTFIQPSGPSCSLYPLNGCAHPQFCKDGCAGRSYP